MQNWMRGAVVLAAAVGVMGCSSNNPPPAQVYLYSRLQAGANPANCRLGEGNWLLIGTEAGSAKDGDNQAGGGVSVQCSVTAAGNGFNVFAFTELSGPNGGAMTVGATGSPVNFPPSGNVSNVAISTSSNTDDPSHTLKEPDCTFTYTDSEFNGNGPGIAAGRVWGSVTCPSATDNSKSPPDQCEIDATFRFENCSQ